MRRGHAAVHNMDGHQHGNKLEAWAWRSSGGTALSDKMQKTEEITSSAVCGADGKTSAKQTGRWQGGALAAEGQGRGLGMAACWGSLETVYCINGLDEGAQPQQQRGFGGLTFIPGVPRLRTSVMMPRSSGAALRLRSVRLPLRQCPAQQG